MWRWAVGDALIERRLWMAHGQNTSYVQHTVVDARGPHANWNSRRLCTWRDYHWQHRGRRDPVASSATAHGVRIVACDGAAPYRVLATGASSSADPRLALELPSSTRSRARPRGAGRPVPPGTFRISLGSRRVLSALILTAEPGEPGRRSKPGHRVRTREARPCLGDRRCRRRRTPALDRPTRARRRPVHRGASATWPVARSGTA